MVQNQKQLWSLSLRGVFVTACLLTVSISLSLALGEVLVRAVRPQPTSSFLVDSLGRYFTESGFNSFTLEKNYRGTEPSQERPGQRARISTNSSGLRGRELSSVDLETSNRILILGDSYTFGVYVNDNETYPAVLESLLQGEGYKSLVLNAGYANGFETDEHYCWLVNVGRRLKPQVVILGLFAGNDIMGIRPEFWVETNSKGLPTRTKNPYLFIDHGILRSKEMNYHTVGADWIYTVPLLKQSHLCIAANRWTNHLVSMLRGDTRNSLEKEFPHIFRASSDEFDKKEAIFLKLIMGMRDAVRDMHAEFLVAMIPLNFQVESEFLKIRFPHDKHLAVRRDYYKELESKLLAAHIPYINLLEEMRNCPSEKYFPRNGEVHFNQAGHRFAASRLKEYLINQGWLNAAFK